MLLLNGRVRELERLGSLSDEEGMRRTLAQIKAALTPEQAAQLSSWLKQAGAVNGDLATAFDSCRLQDALSPALASSAAAELRSLVAASAAGAKAAALGLASSLPSGLGGGAAGSPSVSPHYGSVGGYGQGGAIVGGNYGSLNDAPNGGHAGGGPLRGRSGSASTAPIAIGSLSVGAGSGGAGGSGGLGGLGAVLGAAGAGGRARERGSAARASRGGNGHGFGGGQPGAGEEREGDMLMAFPMEADDDGGRSAHAGGGGQAGSFSAAHVGSLGAGPSAPGSVGAGGPVSRSWDDIESAQAILSLHGCTPPHANSYNVQSMDLQFQ